MKTVTILGAGVMGSAMTLPFADRGFEVRLVGTHLDGEIIESVRANRLHPKLNVTLPSQVKSYTHDQFAQAVGNDTDLILLGVASAGVNWAIERLSETLSKAYSRAHDHQGHAPPISISCNIAGSGCEIPEAETGI